MDKNTKKASRTVILMILFTLFAKALGMVRQILIANIFGADMAGIAFSAASKIPFAIFDMLFSTAIVGSFLPIYRGNLLKSEDAAKKFSSSFLSAVTLILTGVAALGVIFAGPLLHICTPNLDAETSALATNLLRIMFPSVIFAGSAYTLIGILQSHESFLLPASVSAISNLTVILYLAFFAQNATARAVYGLAVAYLLSWFVQFLTLAIPLAKKHRLPHPTAKIKNPDLRLSLMRSLPVMLGSWLIPIGTLAANFFSSYIDGSAIAENTETGAAIVVFENAFSVYSIAAGLLTYGICNFIFPKLSAAFAGGDKEGFARSVRKTLLFSLAMMLPIAAALFFLSENGISLLYERGNYTPALVQATGMSLRALALALPAYGLIELFSRVCYSSGKVRYPMIAAIVGICTSLTFSSIFLLTETLSVFTVALSCALGEILAALTLLVLTLRAFPEIAEGFPLKKSVTLLASFLFSTATMAFFKKIVQNIPIKSLVLQNLVIITIVFLIGLVVYLLCIGIFNIVRFSSSEK